MIDGESGEAFCPRTEVQDYTILDGISVSGLGFLAKIYLVFGPYPGDF
jgi:hypothetical protein